MAKKYKRNVSRSARPATENASSPSPAPSTATPGRRVAQAEFNPDYTYVIKDLKRIGTLAGSFFIILIVLSFFLK
ncbi:hypothetical protein ATHL_00948 [Anaerolinea thermolimosa]|uniref:hypothetical protein n=1 Tax=Anaerolinea thermolimosa TaxID=229919 RepID=UPI000780563B|nr:hypothetical protein [Anaerolinea thermolimosa]GAP06102.1 hypothetical protein ATHL_00948 [Anaerolinea thermolimosa]